MERDEFFTTLLNKGAEWVLDNPVVSVLEDFADETVKERPPGALPEKEFLERCTGCDECMKACPVNVIMIEDMEKRHPVIFPEKDPCIHCADTPCVSACPTGALQTLKF
ncbi:MAG: Electron transport complex subunit RsxB [Chlamydiae bacterium]|nr:Electron transport complex subunit RsxB [Chlamydiota bacterium]